MKTREEVILIIKDICEENKDINLSISEIAVPVWKFCEDNIELSETQAKDIGRIGALSLAFDIKKEDL